MSSTRITCPNKGCLADLQLSENPENGRVLACVACSLIEGEVDCDQECVRRMNVRRYELFSLAQAPSGVNL